MYKTDYTIRCFYDSIIILYQYLPLLDKVLNLCFLVINILSTGFNTKNRTSMVCLLHV